MPGEAGDGLAAGEFAAGGFAAGGLAAGAPEADVLGVTVGEESAGVVAGPWAS